MKHNLQELLAIIRKYDGEGLVHDIDAPFNMHTEVTRFYYSLEKELRERHNDIIQQIEELRNIMLDPKTPKKQILSLEKQALSLIPLLSIPITEILGGSP